MIGCSEPWAWAVACLLGESSQQPTWPHSRQMRRCTQRPPIFRQSSQPLVGRWVSRGVSLVTWPQGFDRSMRSTAFMRISRRSGLGERLARRAFGVRPVGALGDLDGRGRGDERAADLLGDVGGEVVGELVFARGHGFDRFFGELLCEAVARLVTADE